MESEKEQDHSGISSRVLLVLMIIGIALLVYPSLADYWNSFHQSRAIRTYAERVAKVDSREYEKMISDAARYNQALAESGIQWEMGEEQLKEYHSLLNFDGTGVMGYIDVPKIRVKLPVYHGTEEAVLQTSIGHLTETSLPVGGSGSHCVLSGHRGLPSARLFSDLDKLVEGDTFTLSILNESYTYEVDRIRVVEPKDLSELQIEPERDLCTLVTCTPYGVNTHRLLVRGHRIQNIHGNAEVVDDALMLEPAFVAPFIMLPLVLLLLAVLFAAPAK